jgi:hypothetical protein
VACAPDGLDYEVLYDCRLLIPALASTLDPDRN